MTLENKTPLSTARTAFWDGVLSLLPILAGVAPFGIIYGAVALKSGIDPIQAIAMSSLVFAGSAQFLIAQLWAISTPAVLILVAVAVINLRHALYSASIAPHLSSTHPLWKIGLSYLLTDEAYAAIIARIERHPGLTHWLLLGSGLTLWLGWQLSTVAGVVLGTQIPAHWPLDFALPLTFIAIAVPMIRNRPQGVVAVTACVLSVLLSGLPYKLGLLMAALSGIALGLGFERHASKRRLD